MMRLCTCLSLAALLPAAAFSQTETAPKFEISEIQTSPKTAQPFARGPFYVNPRYEIHFATMLDLVSMAYGLDPEKVYGGPSWLELDRFDVFAKTAGASNSESRRLMLRALLAERFGLTIHNDNKPMAGFALTAGKHPLLKEADGTGEPGCNFKVENAPPPSSGPPTGPIQLPVIVYTCRNTSMAAFAGGMLAMAGAGQYFNNRPVADQTALTGNWDFNLRFTPKIPAGIQTTGENIPLFDAVEKQLGLKLEAANVPMAVVVVDRVNRKPTLNAPEADKAFPPPPSEFDVAEIKPSAPLPAGRRDNGPQPEVKNGRLYLPGITLQNLIQIAWDLNGNDFLSGAPKWLNDDRFDVIAKAPEGVAFGDLTPSRTAIPVNIDALRPMLRTLIVDRFKLASHMEDKAMNTYVLSAPKPKLSKADPNSRTRWHEGTDTESKNSRNANASLGRLVTCQNVTMAQFAEMLPGIAPAYVRTQVVDATGLEGGWDFTFSFSPLGALNQASNRAPESNATSDSAPEASDPNGAISLFDAMVKQLGLKLDVQKRPLPVLVIDHVERKPVDN